MLKIQSLFYFIFYHVKFSVLFNFRNKCIDFSVKDNYNQASFDLFLESINYLKYCKRKIWKTENSSFFKKTQ